VGTCCSSIKGEGLLEILKFGQPWLNEMKMIHGHVRFSFDNTLCIWPDWPFKGWLGAAQELRLREG
jgi:hypothetical protein